MKHIPQLCVILGFSFLGELCHLLIPAPIPASIYGMVLLFAALALKILPKEAVADSGCFLSSCLPVMFVAPAVNLVSSWDILKDSLVGFLSVIVISTVVTFAVAGWTTQLLMRRKGGGQNA